MNIASLSSLRRREEEGEDRSPRPNEYFAGGFDDRGGGSGVAVMGPGDPRSAIENIINRAERTGEVDTENAQRLTIYANGFTFGDRFFSFDDEANRGILRDLERGFVPRQIMPESHAGPVNVVLDDKRHEDYTPPPYVAFSGSAFRMASAASTEGIVIHTEIPAELPEVDSSQPTTNLQVRLHNGTRLRLTLNHTHRVADILPFIRRDGAANQPFTLLGGYPVKPITDYSQTLQEAGLLNASLTQKLA